jgi:hypothetical protein
MSTASVKASMAELAAIDAIDGDSRVGLMAGEDHVECFSI